MTTHFDNHLCELCNACGEVSYVCDTCARTVCPHCLAIDDLCDACFAASEELDDEETADFESEIGGEG